ncbi:MAG: stage IV sporulation protein A [Ruminococcaceae bacterium]|nr:stage IV sporulation protein A [Oscillospiraceae bacterium]
MMNTNIYRDIAERTGGNIYLGVVGPVRTGKSTFIKKFMETLVLPNITDPYDKERTRDEMPQSAAGKTVMTAEPKFIPDEAVTVMLSDNARLSVRMIDCVGYIVPDAIGHIENGGPRMVHTPWQEAPMPFHEAAEMGTRKVITDHSTIGIVVTTDGTVGEIPRQNYVEAETRVIRELKALHKPFAVIVNSADPAREESIRLATALENEHGVPVALVNCLDLNTEDIKHILEMILLEFPIREIAVDLPGWVTALESDHPLVSSVKNAVLDCAASVSKIGDLSGAFDALLENEYIETAQITDTDLGSGRATLTIKVPEMLYYRTLGELTGFAIDGEESLIGLLRELSVMKGTYDKLSAALTAVNEKGYGIVTPDISELTLAEPEILRQPSGYGVKLKASGPSIHMIRAEIETEINPIVGSEQQSQELVRSMLSEYENDPTKLWESKIFGKSLHELMTEGLHAKLDHMPDEARKKLGETLQKVINEGSGGLICIIL